MQIESWHSLLKKKWLNSIVRSSMEKKWEIFFQMKRFVLSRSSISLETRRNGNYCVE